MALFGFKGLGWFLCCATVAPGCYIVTSQGAAEQARLQSVESRILEARKEIRNLETEFNSRANMTQLELWNGEVLALASPAPQQYLASEDALADLDSSSGDEVQLAQLVIPAGAPKPLPETAVVQPESAEQTKRGTAVTAQLDDADKIRPAAVAMLDDKLLDELKKRARVEQLALR